MRDGRVSRCGSPRSTARRGSGSAATRCRGPRTRRRVVGVGVVVGRAHRLDRPLVPPPARAASSASRAGAAETTGWLGAGRAARLGGLRRAAVPVTQSGGVPGASCCGWPGGPSGPAQRAGPRGWMPGARPLLGGGAARVDDRLDAPVHPDDVDRGLAQDLVAAAVDERVAGTGVGEADREPGAVDVDDVGVLGQHHPGEPAAVLGLLEDVGPQARTSTRLSPPRGPAGCAATGCSAGLAAGGWSCWTGAAGSSTCGAGGRAVDRRRTSGSVGAGGGPASWPGAPRVGTAGAAPLVGAGGGLLRRDGQGLRGRRLERRRAAGAAASRAAAAGVPVTSRPARAARGGPSRRRRCGRRRAAGPGRRAARGAAAARSRRASR